jgi:hypothetical protein
MLIGRIECTLLGFHDHGPFNDVCSVRPCLKSYSIIAGYQFQCF